VISFFCDLVIMYTTVTRPGHLMFIIFMSQYARLSYCTWSIILIISVIVITFSSRLLPNIFLLCPTCTVTASSYSFFYCFFPFMYNCWSTFDGPWFFSIRAWGDRRVTVWRNPGRLFGVSPKFFVICILAFCLWNYT